MIFRTAVPAEKDEPPEIDSYTQEPGPVIKLAADKVVLIVVGAPADANGTPRGGHPTQALLSAYWFQKRGDRWFKTVEQLGFAQEGFYGVAGDLQQITLGGGKTALTVENRSCWQGACGNWLSIYAIGEDRIDHVFGDMISSSTEGVAGGCSDVLELPAGRQTRVPLEDLSGGLGCYKIFGEWKISPVSTGPGRLVIKYQGDMADAKVVPIQSTANSDEASPSDGEDVPSDEYLVTIKEIRARQIYRYVSGKYVLERGKNPNPPL